MQAAIEALQGRGQRPTIDNIRMITGVGSRTTIAQYLRDWHKQQGHAETNLPVELYTAVEVLWETVQQRADERITLLQEEHVNVVAQQEATYKVLEAEHHQAMADKAVLKDTLDNLQTAYTLLQAQLRATEQENDAYAIRLEDAEKQHTKDEAENTRLHNLTTKMQENLTHFHEAKAQQQQENDLRFDKQKNDAKQEENRLREQLFAEQAAHQKEQKQHYEAQATVKQLQTEQEKIAKQLARAEAEAKTVPVLKERCEQIQRQLQNTQDVLQQKETSLLELQNKLAVAEHTTKEQQLKIESLENKV